MSDERDDFKKVLPQPGDIVEVYGLHRGWVRTAPIVTLMLEDGVAVGFSVCHPDNDSAGLHIRYENGKTPWRWPIYTLEVALCHDCIGNMLRKRVNGGSRPTVTLRPRNIVACAHETFVIDP